MGSRRKLSQNDIIRLDKKLYRLLDYYASVWFLFQIDWNNKNGRVSILVDEWFTPLSLLPPSPLTPQTQNTSNIAKNKTKQRIIRMKIDLNFFALVRMI